MASSKHIKMIKNVLVPLIAVLLFPSARIAYAVTPTPDEISKAGLWVAAKFERLREKKPTEGFLTVQLKSGRLQKNQVITQGYGLYTISTRPLRIADRVFKRGLHCPSEGKVVVHLPAPAKTFKAFLGVDSNRITGYPSNAGRGRVIATIQVGQKEVFRSSVMREGNPAVPVMVDLYGATKFTLELTGAEGGIVQRINFNQADWAHARVTLVDGSTVWLGDLPVAPLPEAITTEAPFSFVYGDQPSSELLTGWTLDRGKRKLDENRTKLTLSYTDPKTGLQVRCEAVEYKDFPAVEWIVYFKNTSQKPTPILQRICALDMRLQRSGDGEFLLHHANGCGHSGLVSMAPTQYGPLETRLTPGSQKRLAAVDGLPAGGDLPFFNVEWPGQGIVVAVGWPGQWQAQFVRDDVNGLSIQAGQEFTHFKLLPGEELRTPQIAMLFWKGNWMRSQNLWRKWMIAHNMPRPGGKLPPPQLAGSSAAQHIEMSGANEQNQLAFIDRYLAEKINVDYWWMDAGWYWVPEKFNGFWGALGTWETDPKRFPRGLRPISDYIHKHNGKTIVWVALEWSIPESPVYQEHPEYFLARGARTLELWLEEASHMQPEGLKPMLNLGNPKALDWAVNYFDKFITEQGVDVFRIDGDPPLPVWSANDTEDRQGITEIRHIEGLLAFWDELQRRHPNLMHDICGGGGGRNELEALRRAVPLWRSDYAYETTGMQNMTYGMSMWIPFFGTGTNALDPYTFRSQMAPALSCVWDLRRRDLDYDLLRRLISQWRQVADNYYGDFYPLTPYRTDNDVWMAWQFDRPDTAQGMVQAFRRPKSAITAMNFKLHSLDPAARYSVKNLDIGLTVKTTGIELMEKGLQVSLNKQPDSALIIYNRLK